ncbi:MAG: hypothetical protein ACI9V1_003237 [Spirosomataceae bacterium]|jgi:hypothetical protein
MKNPISFQKQQSLSFNYGKVNVRVSSIKYAESVYGNYTILKFINRKQILSSYTLNYYSSILEESKLFVIVRKGILINLSFMKCTERRTDGVYVIMQDGSEFRVSRRKGKAFLDLAKHKNTAYLNNNNLH